MRRLILDDARDLAEIRKMSFEDVWSEEEIASMLSDESFFGFREDHGFILCRRAFDIIDVVTFCVDPLYRGKGIGKHLLAEVMRLAQKDKCKIFLEVAEKNIVARNLYTLFGFQEISIRKNYYKFKDGVQNAVLMNHV